MPRKILIVDDEPDLLRVTVLRLKTKGLEVLSAVNGKEALKIIEESVPDLIFLDLRLPDIYGDELCRRIKATEKLKKIPVILFTASADNISEAVKASGADDYLIKPFESDILLEKVEKFVKQKEY